MIATKIDRVYSVSLPQDVRTAISRLSMVISLGLNGIATTPLECLGLAGYVPRLLFWMVLPFVIVALVLVVVAVMQPRRSNDQQFSIVESMLPPFNLIMFLLYPRVTQIAFEGFPCYELADGTGYLVVDVSIECRTAEHNSALGLAWLAVVMYPVGLMAFNGCLLFLARKAITSGKSTPLSRSIAFLYREYEPHMYLWEVGARSELMHTLPAHRLNLIHRPFPCLKMPRA